MLTLHIKRAVMAVVLVLGFAPAPLYAVNAIQVTPTLFDQTLARKADPSAEASLNVLKAIAQGDQILASVSTDRSYPDFLISQDGGKSFQSLPDIVHPENLLKDGNKLYLWKYTDIQVLKADGTFEKYMDARCSDVDRLIKDGVAYSHNGYSRITVWQPESAPFEVSHELEHIRSFAAFGTSLLVSSDEGLSIIADHGRGGIQTFTVAGDVSLPRMNHLYPYGDKVYAIDVYGALYILSQSGLEKGKPEVLFKSDDVFWGVADELHLHAFNGKLYVAEEGFFQDSPSDSLTVFDLESESFEGNGIGRSFRQVFDNGTDLFGADADGIRRIEFISSAE